MEVSLAVWRTAIEGHCHGRDKRFTDSAARSRSTGCGIIAPKAVPKTDITTGWRGGISELFAEPS